MPAVVAGMITDSGVLPVAAPRTMPAPRDPRAVVGDLVLSRLNIPHPVR
jgi:hypothetical protein